MMEKQDWKQLKQFKLPYFGKIIEQIAFLIFLTAIGLQVLENSEKKILSVNKTLTAIVKKQ